VRFPEWARKSPEAIGGLPLASTSGALVPLAQVAQIQLQTGESTITHEMTRRYILVKLNYRDRDVPSIVADAKKAIAQKVIFDSKRYRIEWGGEFEKQQRAEARFRLIIGLILVVMAALLYAEFGVLRQVLLILGVVPLATLGGPDGARPHRHHAQRRVGGRIHSPVRRRGPERGHHGREPQPPP